MVTKKCGKCEFDKPTDEFFKSKRNKDGCRSHCKVCENKANRSRDVNYKELRKDYRQGETYKEIKRKYYKANTKKILSENAAWRQTFKGRLLSYKRAAKKRNVDWLLTDDEFKTFWQQPCAYCGDKIETIGIDRVENDKGYFIGNCKPCCTTCNMMKMTLTKDEFINKMKIILNNLNEKL